MLAIRLTYRALWTQIVLALAYAVPLLTFGGITQTPGLDGLLGGMLGLWICSLPARNAIDVMFANRFALRSLWRSAAGRRWLALNALVLFAGWGVLFLGIVSLIGS